MSAALHSLIEVHLHWAKWHRWRAGQSLQQDKLVAHCLWIGQSGVVTAASAGRTWDVSNGDVLFFSSGSSRTILTNDGAQWISIGLTASSPGQSDLLRILPLPLSWQVEGTDALKVIAKQLVEVEEKSASTLLSEALTRSLFGLLWQQCATANLDEAAAMGFPAWLLAAIQKMQSSASIGIAEIAREVGVSPAHLRRAWHEHLSCSPQEYSRQRRLEAARRAVETSSVPLHVIAEQFGFCGAAQFSRAMKKKFGITPQELRLAAQQLKV